jgi:hypothetical protein
VALEHHWNRLSPIENTRVSLAVEAEKANLKDSLFWAAKAAMLLIMKEMAALDGPNSGWKAARKRRELAQN